MQGDREQAELINDATNRPLEALSRVRPPYYRQPGATSAKATEQVRVDLSDGARYQQLYTQYAEGVEAASPVNKTLAVARNAAKDGQSTDVIVQILRHDPKAQQFGSRSDQFVQAVTQSAVRKTQAQSFAMSQQQQKTPTLER